MTNKAQQKIKKHLTLHRSRASITRIFLKFFDKNGQPKFHFEFGFAKTKNSDLDRSI